MKEEEALVRVVRVVRGSWKLNGVSLVDLKWFAGESKEKVPLPSRVGTESREGRRSPCSCRSRCSRFMEIKRSVRGRFDTVQGREGRKETGVSAVIPRSRRSRCSRFRKFKLRVRWNVKARGMSVRVAVWGAKKRPARRPERVGVQVLG